jgi:hypothetical protein
MSQGVAMTRGELEAMIIRRCWRDEAFRREFTADPKAAFVKYLGVPAAAVPKLVLHEETPGTWHIVLPPRPPNTDELTDAELERIAGGVSPLSLVVSIATYAAASAGVSAYVTKEGGGW